MSRRSPRFATQEGIPSQLVSAFKPKDQNVLSTNEKLPGKPTLNGFSPFKDRPSATKEPEPVEAEAPIAQEDVSRVSADGSECGSSICDRTIYPDSVELDHPISINNILGYLSDNYLSDAEDELIFTGRDSEVESVWSIGSYEFTESDQDDLEDPFDAQAAERDVQQLTEDVATLNYSDTEEVSVGIAFDLLFQPTSPTSRYSLRSGLHPSSK